MCWERDSFLVSEAGGALTLETLGVVSPGGVDGPSLAWMPLLPLREFCVLSIPP